MTPRRHNRPLHIGALIAVVLALVTSASAEVRVGESVGGGVVVEAHDATVGQVLAALVASHRIQVRSSDSLSRTITGTYSGKLPHVLSRILDGYNYFIEVSSSGTRLHIVDVAPSDAAAAAFVAAVPMMANGSRPVSSNVDLDEERAAETAAGPSAKAPPPLPQRAPTTPYPVVPTRTAGGPASTRVSTNVDLDEETSR
jgi:hypothetical protein